MNLNKRVFHLLAVLTLIFALTFGCGGAWGSEASVVIDSSPSDPEASEEAKKVLAYLAALTGESSSGVISGQNCGHGNEIALGNYNTFIEKLHEQTGQYVGMIGIDYEYMREFTLEELLSANTFLKDHWQKGGWVTINWSPDNPWGTINDYQDIRKKYSGTNLKRLTTPGNPYYDKWMEKLDRIAAALDDLQKSGVVVLWRPMQEGNGWWFWWGKESQQSPVNTTYVAVWRHMYRYFTNEKHLHNLLWVFSPTQSRQFADFPYPGDDYVDVVGGTQYDDNLSIPGYHDYLRYHKPIGMAECGPSEFTGAVVKGTFDDRLYVNRLKKNYPHVAYWVTWHSWPGVKMSIVDNENASACLNDPYVINRGARE